MPQPVALLFDVRAPQKAHSGEAVVCALDRPLAPWAARESVRTGPLRVRCAVPLALRPVDEERVPILPVRCLKAALGEQTFVAFGQGSEAPAEVAAVDLADGVGLREPKLAVTAVPGLAPGRHVAGLPPGFPALLCAQRPGGLRRHVAAGRGLRDRLSHRPLAARGSRATGATAVVGASRASASRARPVRSAPPGPGPRGRQTWAR